MLTITTISKNNKGCPRSFVSASVFRQKDVGAKLRAGAAEYRFGGIL